MGMIRNFILLVLFSGLTVAVEARMATLLRDETFQLVNGSSAVVPSGTSVTVMAENGDKVRVARSAIASAWVSRADVLIEGGGQSIATPTPGGLLAKGQRAIADAKAAVQNVAGGNSTATQAVVGGLLDKGAEVLDAAKRAAVDVSNSKFAGEMSAKAGLAADLPTADAGAPETEKTDEAGAPTDAKGTALEALLIDALQKAWDGTPDADKVAARVVTALKLDATKLPQVALAALSGTPLKNGAAKGSLRVSISGEADRRTSPGFSTGDMQALRDFLDGTGNSVVAEVYKTDWRIENGAFCKEARQQKTVKALVLLSDYKDGTFLCRKAKTRATFIYGRLHEDDMLLGGASFALASIDWQDDAPNTLALPADFHYDKTLVLPGQFAFMALPFQRQGKGGICAAASAFNIVQFIAPEIEIEQRGIFALYNGGRSGATLEQMAGGLESLGFECELLPTRGCDKKVLLSKIRASLDAGRPLLVVEPGHALTIIGYNKPDRKLVVWDQRMNRPGVPAYLPRGGVEVSENCIQSRFQFVFFIRKVDTRLSVEEEKLVSSLFGGANGCLRHEIVNGNSDRETLPMFLRHAAMPKVQSVLQQKRILLVPANKRELVSISASADGKYTSKTFPGGKVTEIIESAIVRCLVASKGVFYSMPSESN